MLVVEGEFAEALVILIHPHAQGLRALCRLAGVAFQVVLLIWIVRVEMGFVKLGRLLPHAQQIVHTP